MFLSASDVSALPLAPTSSLGLGGSLRFLSAVGGDVALLLLLVAAGAVPPDMSELASGAAVDAEEDEEAAGVPCGYVKGLTWSALCCWAVIMLGRGTNWPRTRVRTALCAIDAGLTRRVCGCRSLPSPGWIVLRPLGADVEARRRVTAGVLSADADEIGRAHV